MRGAATGTVISSVSMRTALDTSVHGGILKHLPKLFRDQACVGLLEELMRAMLQKAVRRWKRLRQHGEQYGTISSVDVKKALRVLGRRYAPSACITEATSSRIFT